MRVRRVLATMVAPAMMVLLCAADCGKPVKVPDCVPTATKSVRHLYDHVVHITQWEKGEEILVYHDAVEAPENEFIAKRARVSVKVQITLESKYIGRLIGIEYEKPEKPDKKAGKPNWPDDACAMTLGENDESNAFLVIETIMVPGTYRFYAGNKKIGELKVW